MLQKVSKTLVVETNNLLEEVIEGVIQNAMIQLSSRKRSTELRSLQLLVWLYGYKTGILKGHVYQDVLPAFTYWKKELGIRIFIYATGVTAIQKLLFACSLSGNLMPVSLVTILIF